MASQSQPSDSPLWSEVSYPYSRWERAEERAREKSWPTACGKTCNFWGQICWSRIGFLSHCKIHQWDMVGINQEPSDCHHCWYPPRRTNTSKGLQTIHNQRKKHFLPNESLQIIHPNPGIMNVGLDSISTDINRNVHTDIEIKADT